MRKTRRRLYIRFSVQSSAGVDVVRLLGNCVVSVNPSVASPSDVARSGSPGLCDLSPLSSASTRTPRFLARPLACVVSWSGLAIKTIADHLLSRELRQGDGEKCNYNDHGRTFELVSSVVAVIIVIMVFISDKGQTYRQQSNGRKVRT